MLFTSEFYNECACAICQMPYNVCEIIEKRRPHSWFICTSYPAYSMTLWGISSRASNPMSLRNWRAHTWPNRLDCSVYTCIPFLHPLPAKYTCFHLLYPFFARSSWAKGNKNAPVAAPGGSQEGGARQTKCVVGDAAKLSSSPSRRPRFSTPPRVPCSSAMACPWWRFQINW